VILNADVVTKAPIPIKVTGLATIAGPQSASDAKGAAPSVPVTKANDETVTIKDYMSNFIHGTTEQSDSDFVSRCETLTEEEITDCLSFLQTFVSRTSYAPVRQRILAVFATLIIYQRIVVLERGSKKQTESETRETAKGVDRFIGSEVAVG
jgi:hypothetical protein